MCGGTLEIFIEPILGKPVLLIIGGGHVGKAVVHLAHWLGFRVAVSDDRPGFCTPESAPGSGCLLSGANERLTFGSQHHPPNVYRDDHARGGDRRARFAGHP